MVFPLSQHHLGVRARNCETSIKASLGMGLDDVTARNLDSANAAVVRALRSGVVVALDWPTERATFLEEGVLLLNSKPRLLIGKFLCDWEQRCTGVRAMWLKGFWHQNLVEYEHVILATERIRTCKDWAQHAV